MDNVKSYNEYLQSPHWKETRKRALERSGNHCSVCMSTKNLNVHHNNYERLGEELDTDLTVLCKKCHDIFYREGKLSNERIEKPEWEKYDMNGQCKICHLPRNKCCC
jgi:hypothetical protein